MRQIKFMNEVAKDIIMFNPKRKDLNNKQSMNQFYAIMRKHGIKKCTYTRDGGVTGNNYEWTMCLVLFRHVHERNNELQIALGSGTPKDLIAYGEKPLIKSKTSLLTK